MKITRRVVLASAALIVGAPRAVWGCGRRRRSGEPSNRSSPATPLATPPHAVRADAYPNLEAWNKIRVGMTEQEVLALVGPPKAKRGSEIVDGTQAWDYGELRFSSDAFPSPMWFELHMQQGRVKLIEDPYGHIAPGIGAPGVPKLLSPPTGAAFRHYPRYVDLRWRPCAGDHIEYDIEVQFEDSALGEFFPHINSASRIPYLAIVFVGNQGGRWRVRARDATGVSDWSDYRTFTFSV
jgi:hypothetical protein